LNDIDFSVASGFLQVKKNPLRPAPEGVLIVSDHEPATA